MARIRSPNYPAISLADAVKRIETVHAREHQHPAAREVVVKGMGYSGIHGTSLGALSAAMKYGLLEQDGKGEDYRVTDRAIAILHPHNPAEKAEAIRAAARSPSLFNELLEHFKGVLPSDDNLRAYLIRRGFTQSSLPAVVQAFRETMELVSPDAGDYDSATSSPKQESPSMQAQSVSSRATPSSTEPFRVSFSPGGIDVSGRITDMESADELVRTINALKLLLKPTSEIKKPEGGATN